MEADRLLHVLPAVAGHLLHALLREAEVTTAVLREAPEVRVADLTLVQAEVQEVIPDHPVGHVARAADLLRVLQEVQEAGLILALAEVQEAIQGHPADLEVQAADPTLVLPVVPGVMAEAVVAVDVEEEDNFERTREKYKTDESYSYNYSSGDPHPFCYRGKCPK